MKNAVRLKQLQSYIYKLRYSLSSCCSGYNKRDSEEKDKAEVEENPEEEFELDDDS